VSKNQNTVLMWCDLETTGLKPVKNHRILEYAVVFTDLELNELGSCGGVISQDLEIVQALMDDYVINMHTQNGLLKDLADLEQYTAGYSTSLLEAQERILKTLHDVKNKVTDYQVEVIFVIAGNTVGFDKGYIEYHMPRLFDRLHYRQLDVSSYKVGFPETFGTATSDAHRAMADIRDSIEQHRKMRGLVADGLLAEKAFDGVGKFIMDSKSHDD
jgi:oligoribonuclease